MATAKLVLIFPAPQDEAAFEQVYHDVHLPLVEEKLNRLNRFVAPTGSPNCTSRT